MPGRPRSIRRRRRSGRRLPSSSSAVSESSVGDADRHARGRRAVRTRDEPADRAGDRGSRGDAATFGGVVEGTDGDGSGEGTSGGAGVGEADGSGSWKASPSVPVRPTSAPGQAKLAVGVADGSGSVAEADVTPTPSTSDAAAATRPHRTNRRAYLSCWRCTVSTAPEVTTDRGLTVWATASAPRTGSVVVGDGSPDRPNVDPFRASLERVRDAHRPTPRAATRHRSAPPRCGRRSALMSDPAATMAP